MIKTNIVALMVIVSFFCMNPASVAAVENAVPVASFTSDVVSGKVPLEVRFNDTSSGEPTAWEWDFGDGSTSSSQNASHTYMGPGDYTVSLLVSNANGSDSLTKIGYISADTRPVVAIDYISPNPAIRGETVSLVGLYVYNYTAIPLRGGHEWYSDLVGRVCTGRTLYISTLPAGNHTMSFRDVDSQGQWSEPVYSYLVILENSLPVATIDSITPNPAKPGQSITFIGTGTDPDGKNISAYEWRSSIDNMLSDQPGFSISNLSVGTHTIYFKVKDHVSWSPAVSRTVTVIGNTEYLQAGFVKSISVNNPTVIRVNVSDIGPVSADFSITDSTGAAVFRKNITEDLAMGMYAFEWDATDQLGEPLPDGTYTLNLFIRGASGEEISELADVTVDNTAPAVIIDDISGVITSEGVVYANPDLMVNVSESGGDAATVSITLSSDSGSEMETIDANYEDGIWIGNFDLSSVSDGNYIVTATATDTARNSNTVASDMIVNVDKTAPVIGGFTPSDGQDFTEGTSYVNVRFDYSDAGAGINVSSISLIVDTIDVTSSATIAGSSASYNATGLAPGAHSVSLYIEDIAGNAGMFTTSFQIGSQSPETVASGRSSGSSGGGGGMTGEKYENILVKEMQGVFVNAGSQATYEFRKDGNAITSIRFDALRNSGKIQAIVEVLKGSSSFARADAPGNVYQQMNIWVGSTGFVNPGNVKNLLIGFKVEKSWLKENSIDASSVKLCRYADDSWVALTTSVVGEDNGYVYFESQTPGFSPFAIISEASATEKTDLSLRSVSDTAADEVADEGLITETAMTGITSTGVVTILGAVMLLIAGAYIFYRERS